jgi:hypothetical protein
MPFFIFGQKNSGAGHYIQTPHNPKKPIENNLLLCPTFGTLYQFFYFQL